LGLLGSAAIVLPAAAVLTPTMSGPTASPADTTAHTTARLMPSDAQGSSSTQVQATLTADVTPGSPTEQGQQAASSQPAQSGPAFYPSAALPEGPPSWSTPTTSSTTQNAQGDGSGNGQASPTQINPGGVSRPGGNGADQQGTWNQQGGRSHWGHHKEHRGNRQSQSGSGDSTTTHVSVPPMIAYDTANNWDSGFSVPGGGPGPFVAGTGTTTLAGTSTVNPNTNGGLVVADGSASASGATSSTASSAPSVPVFNGSGAQVGSAVLDQATGAVELVGPSGTILGAVQQQNGMLNLVGSGGAVIGSFSYNPNTAQVLLGAPGTGTSTSATGTTVTGTTTGSTAGTGTTTTASASASAPASVPVFNSSGAQVGSAVLDQATGAVELVGPSGTILGAVQQQNGMLNLVGSGGAVIGSFSYNPNTAQVLLGAPGSGTSTGTTATMTSTTTADTSSTGAVTTASTASTAVPVFDNSGIQVGVAALNPATGATELVGYNSNILGVVAQQNGTIYLVGSGGTVIGGFTVSPATGQVVFTPATSTSGAAGTTTGSTTGAAS
jgi:hypothetical protein